MCFICKLSFGITKSFSLHANTEHGLDLQELEKHLLMQREYSSAIIQRNMDESPQISFLEPVDVDTPAQQQQQQPLISSSTATELSGMESQDNQSTNTQQSAAISTGATNINSSASSLSSTSSTSPSTLSSPCCTSNSTLTTSNTTTTTPREMPQIISSPHDEEQQSYSSMYDSTTSSVASTSTTITTTTPTLSSLNLDKSKTNNYNINESVTSDNLTTNIATSTITVTSSATCSVAKIVSSSSTTTTTKSALTFSSTPHSSSTSSSTGVDLSTSTGNLATEAISTDSLVNLNKLNNDNSNHNDSIEPQPHDMITTHSSLSPKSLHITPSHQSAAAAASLNTNMMSDFLQQHLQRLTTERITADEDSQHKNLDNDNLSWSQPSANTFPIPATAANASVAQISSLHASLAALNSEQNSSSVKLISKFLQHQLVAAQQQQQQQHQKQLSSHSLNHAEAFMNQANVSTTNTTTSMHNVCPEHPDFKGIDCKTCEMLDAHQNFKPSPQVTPQRSPTNSGIAAAAAAAAAAAGLGLLTAANKLSMSPNHSLNANTLPTGLNVPLNTPPINNPASAASFTIGACSDHINGRPLGVECAR